MTPLRIGKAALSASILIPCSVQAATTDSEISVNTSPNPVSERESFQLRIVVDSPLAAPVVQPTFDAPDFILTGAPKYENQPIGGDDGPNTRKRYVWTFILMPKKSGELFIRNIQSKVNWKPVTSPDVHVKVIADNQPHPRATITNPAASTDNDESSNPAAPGYLGRDHDSPPAQRHMSVPDRFNSDFTVWANVNKIRAYVGEPIVVEYYLYDFGGLRQTEILQWPTFNGFWKEDLEITTRVAPEEVYVNQQEMRRAFVARYALYGIKPGRFSLDKLGVRGKYISEDMVRSGLLFSIDLRTGQHYSQDVSVEILPLPEAGRPANFGGAVGKFNLTLQADKLTIAQNTPLTLTFTLTGKGNFQAIDSIKPPLPADFEMYESTANSRPTPPIGIKQELESKKTFQTVAIPRKAGKFEIPSVSWSYFNTEKAAYETITTQPFNIEVQPNEGGAVGSNNYLAPSPTKPGDPDAQEKKLRALKDPDEKSYSLRLVQMLLWLLLATNGLLGIRFLKGRTRGLVRLVKGMDPFSEARILLLQAKGIRDSEWQAGLEEVIFATLQVLLETNPRGLTKHDLEELWKSKCLPPALHQRASALLGEIDRHRFSSQKLTGSGTREVRSRLTRETESLLIESSQALKKATSRR